LSFNVWSREDVVVYKRMQAIGALVKKHDPDVIFFQEITPYIRSIFEDLAWWNKYYCSPVPPEELETEQSFCLLLSKLPLENTGRWKFANSPTGRGYLEADINPDPATMKPIRVATTQLERPSPPAPMRCMERYAQAEHAVAALSSAENVVFGGDMCWRDGTDRPFPLLAGWFDAWLAWTALGRCSGSSNWTYDGIWEEKVLVFNGFAAPNKSTMQNRSDRFLCKLRDYKLSSIELIEDRDVGPYYSKHWGPDSESLLHLKPSCHRGMVLTIVPK
ncbi:hypothetical protein BAE44_0025542, partial [Dichanthelium oligosanthes]